MAKRELEKVYEPKNVEDAWLKVYAEKDIFRAGKDKDKPCFTMVIPPPNVTGSLHMGHALNNTLQDSLARYKRLKGFDVLWVPGTDHAGIATQNVVEKKLHAEGSDRHSLGREKFIERVWQWKEESGGTIVKQLKRLGASCDWSREAFTMNENLSKAVIEVFVRLYEEGLLYRDERLINWCPRCLTALSDIEVEHEESHGKLYHIRYHLADNEKEFLTVATTRPETMLGDTAVAVHPEDERFNKFIGKEVLLPLTTRKIKIVGDTMVDREFGTGAVKITPAHDFNDFEAGQRHNLKRIAIFDERAHVKDSIEDVLPEVMSEIKTLHAHKAREKVIHILKENGFLTKSEDNPHAVGKCYRCKTVIEPYLSPQWYVKTRPLADEAVKAVESGKTKIIPEGWQNTYFEWMRNIKDWCVSRQIWWGHRIPAWYCEDCNKGKFFDVKGEKKFLSSAIAIVSKTGPTKCPKCGGIKLYRENDVLDTWFSSALWPFSTLGWPEKTADLKRYYPTSTLVTGFDIIFFWVARMMMMGIKFMGEVPFKDVYIHALVRDAEGQKMSKSKGNVIDPLSEMEKYGTDALRFTLIAMAAQGRDIKLSEERIEGYRNFCNKIWNLARFTLMNLTEEDFDAKEPEEANYALFDKWIITKLAACRVEMERALDNYEFDAAARAAYSFVWHELCDWYVEAIKKDLYGEFGEERRKTAVGVLTLVLKDALKLLHPFMPFITEEVYSYLPGDGRIISESEFPMNRPAFRKEEIEAECAMDVIRAIRNIRTELNIAPSVELKAICLVEDASTENALKQIAPYLSTLARVKELNVQTGKNKPEGSAFSQAKGIAENSPIEVYVPLKGIVDAEAETKRLNKELEKLLKEKSGVEGKLQNEAFTSKAPPEVIEKEKARLASLNEKQTKIEASIERMRQLG